MVKEMMSKPDPTQNSEEITMGIKVVTSTTERGEIHGTWETIMVHLTTELVIEDKQLRIKETHMAEIQEAILLSQDNPLMLEVIEPMISREMLELLEIWEEKMEKTISDKNSEILWAKERIVDMIGEM